MRGLGWSLRFSHTPHWRCTLFLQDAFGHGFSERVCWQDEIVGPLIGSLVKWILIGVGIVVGVGVLGCCLFCYSSLRGSGK
jgi:hypothetical protein